jgi:hypothetical protein
VRAAASVLAVVHDAPTSNPDSPERRPAAPVDVVGAPDCAIRRKHGVRKSALERLDNFRESILFAGKSARRFDVPGAPTRVVDVRLFAWYYKAPKRKSQS